MRTCFTVSLLLALLIALTSCAPSTPISAVKPPIAAPDTALPAKSTAGPDSAPDSPPAAETRSAAPHVMGPQIIVEKDSPTLLRPEEFAYLGAFRLPADPGGGSNWEYSGQGLTFYPQGDPGGEADGFPGSLFGVGHDHQLFVSEISIPAPVNSRSLEDLPIAATLQPFADITGGMFGEGDLPRIGIEYLPPQEGQSEGLLYFVRGQHFQDFEPSHGWATLDLSDPRPAGPWRIEGYTNYVTSDYLFAIPPEWAAENTPGLTLATGRFREGVWAGGGPALFAIAPWRAGNPPLAGASLTEVTPLLLYGVQEPGLTDIASAEGQWMAGYLEADHWWDGAWLETGGKSAVVFAGTKALGSSWYGFANGVVWDYDCAEQDPPTCPDVPEWPYDNRGYWAEDYQAQLLLFDPDDLAAVARGEMATWEPQPYAVVVLDDFLYNPEISLEDYKVDLVGAVAFDAENGFLYVIERLADEYRSVVHVWQVGG